MEMLFGLVILAAGLCLWFAIRKSVAGKSPTQKHLARLLLVCGSAFNDRNDELYSATIREIINIMRTEHWRREEIEWKIRRALSIAKTASSRDNFEKASRLAQNIIQAST